MTDHDLATIGVWSYGLGAVGYVAFVIRLLLGWRPGVRAGLLLAATIVSAAWACLGVAVSYRPGMNLWVASVFADALRYACWFLFLGALLRGAATADASARSGPTLWIVVVAVALVPACVFFLYAPPAMAVAEPVLRTAGLALRVGLAVLGLVLVEQVLRRAQPSARWALKPLCVGLGGLFAFDLYLFADAMLFSLLDPHIWIARGAATAFVIPFIAVATARNPTWTIEMHLSRGAVMNSTAVLVSAAFLLLVAGAGYLMRLVGDDWGRALQIEVFFFALLVGILLVTSGRFRSRLRVFVSKHFFSYRYDYREEWLRFTRTLADAKGVRDVQQRTIEALSHLVESPAGALWLRGREAAYRVAATWNLGALDASEPADGSLATFLGRTGWVVDLSELAADPKAYPDLVVPAWLSGVPAAWLVVPLAGSDGLLGFVVLAKARAPLEVNWEVRDLLKAASRHAASYLGQLRATEALVEAQKFDAFNRMSAFVVHDLKNLVAQLSLMLKNAERHRDNPQFQRDMLSTVQHVVDRMNQLMLQLRTGATPVSNPGLTNVEAIVRKVCQALERADAPIALQLAPGLVALGHEDRLDHVIAHLVQNALDATATGGRVSVRTSREGGFAVLDVADTGVGMSPEFVRERLFRPFETSKATGMGIGVYESAQYVNSIGGTIEFDSTPGAGTRVRLRLPAADSPAPPPRVEAVA
ncbi:MAG: PEP-CTERM system histidine kinase PrsK [Burkholderiales bacterium]|nr:PEP-CTERM system histidine kinase PrsK [Burkholderiales bacterium]